MAQRPIFIPRGSGSSLVEHLSVSFAWFPGFAKSQAQRSIMALHQAAAELGIHSVLEISSKSSDTLGVQLSAFNLKFGLPNQQEVTVEAAFQGSKVFAHGGPFHDLYLTTGREAKTDERIRTSGELIGFKLIDQDWPLIPRTAFYDWLYLRALIDNPHLAQRLLAFDGFSDIAFNPTKSINCQAYAAALYVALHQRGLLIQALEDQTTFLQTVGKHERTPEEMREPDGMQLPLF